jgi:nitroimidazol reductase NimA-like FMN-containing flavoprotein (pyridoxamine 5'-phosphate oxidase superfamily)
MTTELLSLAADECLALLGRCQVGRLAVVIDGRPHIVPLNYAVDERGVIVFRTEELTTATEASLAAVAFEVDDIDPEHHTGWSVIVHGRGMNITNALDPESERLRRLPVRPWAAGPRHQWFKITPAEITGRRLGGAAPG